jgi:hypothetical protein
VQSVKVVIAAGNSSQTSSPNPLQQGKGLRKCDLKDIILEWNSSQGAEPIIKALHSHGVEDEFLQHLDEDPNYIKVGSLP